MRLNRVFIKNFRSIREVTINFEPSCRVLVGINESGKSNILKALALLDPTQSPTPEDIREFLPDEDPQAQAYVNFIFLLDKGERLKVFDRFAASVHTDDLSAPFAEYDGKLLSLAQLFDSRPEVIYEVNLRTGGRRFTSWSFGDRLKVLGEWKKEIDNKLLLPRPRTISASAPPHKTATSTFYKLINPNVAPENVGPLLTVTNLEVGNMIALAADDVLTQSDLPQCVFWSYSESNLLPGQINLDNFASNPDTCMPLKHMFIMAGYQDVISAITSAKTRPNGVRNLLKKVSDVATSHMYNVWKEYRGIRIQLLPNGDNIDAAIEDTHNVYNLSRRSDGFKRFITFLLMVSAKVKTKELEDTLYLHDEPDLSLHPSGARYLRDELLKIAEKNYVIYSTHSIFMIDREMIGRHLIIEKKDEITNVSEVNESNIVDEEVIYNSLGYSIFENLRQKNIVFEGWRDKKLFQVAISRVPAEHKSIKALLSQVGTCHAKGVKDIGRITPLLELANRECLIVSDSDQVAREQQKDYDGYGTWLRYDQILDDCPAITGEDFIKPDAFMPAITKLRGDDPTLPELNATNLQVDGGRLVVIQKWLEKSGKKKDEIKVLLNTVKEAIFTDLKQSQIEPSYYALLEQLTAKL